VALHFGKKSPWSITYEKGIDPCGMVDLRPLGHEATRPPLIYLLTLEKI